MVSKMSHPDQIAQWKCSECGVLKGPANHWFCYTPKVSTVSTAIFTVVHLDLSPDAKMLESWRVVCGEKCLHAALSKALEKKSDTPASPRSQQL